MSKQVKQVSVAFDAEREAPGKIAAAVEALLLGAAKEKAEKIEAQESKDAMDDGWKVERIETVHEHGHESLEKTDLPNAEHLATVESRVTLILSKTSGGGGGHSPQDKKQALADKKKADQKKKSAEAKKQEEAEQAEEIQAETAEETVEYVDVVEYEYIDEIVYEDVFEEVEEFADAAEYEYVEEMIEEEIAAFDAGPLMVAEAAAQNSADMLSAPQAEALVTEAVAAVEQALAAEQEEEEEIFALPSYAFAPPVLAAAHEDEARRALETLHDPAFPAPEALPGRAVEGQSAPMPFEIPDGPVPLRVTEAERFIAEAQTLVSTPETALLAQQAVATLAQNDRVAPSELAQAGLDSFAQSDRLLTLDQFQQNFAPVEPLSLLPEFQGNMEMAALPEATPSFALNEASYAGNPFYIPLSLPSLPVAAPAPSMN